MSIDVCIGNYGYYNEGELRDAWISLPKTSEEISDFLSAHGLQDPEHEEIYISDYDGVPFGLTGYDYTGAYARDEWGQTCIERFSADENYGYTVLEDTDLMRMLEKDSDAMSAFDVERYGRLCSDNGDVKLGDKGYVDAVQEMPDEDRYTREELAEMYGDPGPNDPGNPGAPSLERHDYGGVDLEGEALDARMTAAVIAKDEEEDRGRESPGPDWSR